jgi:hypothetical protein
MDDFDIDIEVDGSGFDPNEADLLDFFFDDPFAYAQQATESLDLETGLTCELKAYENRYNARGEIETLQVGKQRRRAALGKNSSLRAAVVLTRHYNDLDKLDYTELRIQSPHIKKALREVIATYPGLKLQAPMIVLRDTPKCLFHYRREIAAYARTLEDPVAREHIQFIQDYAYQQMVQPITSFNLGVEFAGNEPGLEFLNLWMAFRPGDLIYSKTRDVPRVYRLDSMTYFSTSCRLHASYIESDGSRFGHRTEYLSIDIYDNYKPFTQLTAYPLEYHRDKSSIIERLSQRGAQYVSLQGIHYRSFAGNAHGLRAHDEDDDDDDDDGYSPLREGTTATTLVSTKLVMLSLPMLRTTNSFRQTERVIVDITGFRLNHPLHLGEHLGSWEDTGFRLEDTQLILCTNLVPVFALTSRRWWQVPLEDLRDIQFNTEAFDKLILPRNQKQMIQSLVTVHVGKLLKFDDVIAGKGKGMVFLLHGESGTGKTLTAGAHTSVDGSSSHADIF